MLHAIQLSTDFDMCGIRENPALVFIGFSNGAVDRVFRMPSGGKDVRTERQRLAYLPPRWFLPRPYGRLRPAPPRPSRHTVRSRPRAAPGPFASLGINRATIASSVSASAAVRVSSASSRDACAFGAGGAAGGAGCAVTSAGVVA